MENRNANIIQAIVKLAGKKKEGEGTTGLHCHYKRNSQNLDKMDFRSG